MRTCREVEVRGGACCLEKIGGAKEAACADNVFSEDGAGALRSRDDCAGALAGTAAAPAGPECLMQWAHDSGDRPKEFAAASPCDVSAMPSIVIPA